MHDAEPSMVRLAGETAVVVLSVVLSIALAHFPVPGVVRLLSLESEGINGSKEL